eukprot:PRCOL_00004734-RA
MVWEALGRTALAAPLVAFVVHLAIGDLWNAMFTTERRLGAGVVGVLMVWLSVMTVGSIYYGVAPAAAYVFAPSMAWISVATCLVTNIWYINGKEPLYPMKRVDIDTAEAGVKA